MITLTRTELTWMKNWLDELAASRSNLNCADNPLVAMDIANCKGTSRKLEMILASKQKRIDIK